MSDRKNLGEVLLEYGRVSPTDQEQALDYQRTHGGYFGEALVAMGKISREELEFGLAAQFDLPYVFPDPASIDLDAAELVPPEWALANLTLPIARSEDTLSVVVDSPLKPDAVRDLVERTGLAVELAIASPGKIRELIRHVFGEETDEDAKGLRPAASMDDFLDEALASGSFQMGVSLRGHSVTGWWKQGARHFRRPIVSGWPGALDRRVSPSLDAVRDGGGELREAQLAWGGTRIPVSVRRVASSTGEEWMLEVRRIDAVPASFDPPPATFLEEVRLLVRAGAGRFLLQANPDALGPELLPHLPRILLGDHVRAVHLAGDGREGEGGDPGVFTLPVPSVEAEALGLLARLRPFGMEAITADLAHWTPAIASALAGAGVVVVVLAPQPAHAAFGWILQVAREEGGRLRWQVRPRIPEGSGR
jgi:hypothetical protein